MRATWYVLEDGNVADPAECAPDGNGVLRHKSGIAVARRGDTYSSRGVDLRDMQPKPAKAPKDKATEKDRQITAAGSAQTYETR